MSLTCLEFTELLDSCIFICFIGFWKFSVIISVNSLLSLSLSSPSETHIMHVLVHLMVSHRSLRLCSLFFIIFSFYFSALKISITLSSDLQILFSAGSELLLNPSIKFFHFSFALFRSIISIWFLFYNFYTFIVILILSGFLLFFVHDFL